MEDKKQKKTINKKKIIITILIILVIIAIFIIVLMLNKNKSTNNMNNDATISNFETKIDMSDTTNSEIRDDGLKINTSSTISNGVEYNGLMITDIQIESTGDMASFNASVTNDLGKDIEGHLIYLNFLREDGTVIDKVETYFPEIIDGETGYISATTPKDIATAYSLNITDKLEN